MDIPSFITDTKEDKQDRLILYYQTVPSLFINNQNIEEEIKKYKKDLNQFMNEYNIKKEDYEKILKLWFLYDKLDAQITIEGYPTKITEFIKDKKLEFDISNFKSFKNELDKEKKEFKEKIEKNDKIHKLLKDIKGQEYLEFKKEKYKIFFMTETKDLSLQYIFNIINCNENVPFCSFDKMCKIIKNFIPNWKDEYYPNKILLKIKNNNDYLDTFLFIENNTLKIEVSIDSKLSFDIKSHIKTVFTIPIYFGDNFDEHDIYGYYIFPIQKFNKYLLSDMIMNNTIFSKFLAVDESKYASTKKTGLLTKFKGGNIKDSSCNIICKKVLRNDPKIKEYKLKIGDYYIQIHLSNFKNMEFIHQFIFIFSKFLTIYHQDEKKILDIYQSFLGNTFTLLEDEVEQNITTIKEIAPDLFINGYRRICKEERHPDIVDEEDIKELEQNKDYILFPKLEDDENDVQFYYQCKKSKEFPYIGLIKNSLQNRDKYEYIPCCYKKEKYHIDNYYLDKKETNKKQQGIIQTLDRLLDKNYLGLLPSNLDLFLTSLYKDEFYSFYRKGISNSKHSFLDCILYATNSKKIKDIKFEIASQENPDLSLEKMKELFTNVNEYLDPKRWIRLLEYYYKCNIHVFSRVDKNKNANIVIPYHIPPYLKNKNQYEQTIIILENENSRTKEIRCELVIKKEKKEEFIFNHDLIKNQITQFYLEQNKKPLIKYSLFPKFIYKSKELTFNFKSQVLDSFKKTRCLITNDDIKLLCDPIPPLNLPIEYINDFENDYKRIEEFLDCEIDKNQHEIKCGDFIIKLKQSHKNDLDYYKKNKKIASILGDFFIFLYSRFVNEFNKDINSIQTIKEFIDNYTIIINTEYQIIPSSIIDNDTMKKYGYLSKDEKLMITNQETLKRLLCLLRLQLINNINKVKSYCNQKEFYYFYKDINDYSSFDNILIYEKDIKKINSIHNIVYNSFQELPKYYLYFLNKLYLSEIYEFNLNDNYIIYNTELKIIKEKNKPTIQLIEYKDENDETKYQKLSLF
jgi:hypothetical protein